MGIIRKFFPWFFPSFNVIFGYVYDCYRFIVLNTNNSFRNNASKHEAIIRRRYHGIEKAFSLPNVRKGFGIKNCSDLADEIFIYYHNNGYNDLIEATLNVFKLYINFHEGYNSPEVDKLVNKLKGLILGIPEYKEKENTIGGVIKFDKTVHLDITNRFNFDLFSNSRFSVRDFSDENVDQELVLKSITTAIKTPSVCNRQAWKVHIFYGEDAAKILEYQNGSRGFKSNVKTILLVTGISSSFSNSERNQVFIDGGLFSMSLLYALHGNNLAACALNTAYKVKNEIKLRNAINLPFNEVPIMMLAVGNYKDNYLVAKSYRKSLEEVAIFH